jgi:hypothetical protein
VEFCSLRYGINRNSEKKWLDKKFKMPVDDVNEFIPLP